MNNPATHPSIERVVFSLVFSLAWDPTSQSARPGILLLFGFITPIVSMASAQAAYEIHYGGVVPAMKDNR